jgi:hypothetical protein
LFSLGNLSLLAILMSQSWRIKPMIVKLDSKLICCREATKTLELLRAICRKQGMPEADDPELLVAQPTKPIEFSMI